MSAAAPAATAATRERQLPAWWPLAALTVLAAALRMSTLDLQSFWYDEAFTPVHVLHPSLEATLHGVVHTENTPPLWYLIAWVFTRLFGHGEVALRLPSALAGIATVPVVWALGERLAGRRAALIAAALLAVGPLFVWYSQEARAYSLFVLTSALAMLCCVRARQDPSGRRLAQFAVCGSLALLSHYFAVFLLAPMAVVLALDAWRRPPARRATVLALGALALVGLALVPLVSAQGGHGAQWIGRWPLSERLEAIPQYYLTGASGAPLGHLVELALALPLAGGLGLWLWQVLAVPPAKRTPTAERELQGIAFSLTLAACGVLLPLLLVAFGSDYLAPRNLVGAMVPLTLALAIALGSPAVGSAGVGLGALAVAGMLVVTIDVDLSPRLQRGNWRGLAQALRAGAPDRAITTVELGSAPLEYYLPQLQLHNLAPGSVRALSEIDETGYLPLRADAGQPPGAGFQLTTRRNVDGYIEYRFQSAPARAVSEATLREHVITVAHPEVLVPHGLSSILQSGAVQVVRQRKDLAFR